MAVQIFDENGISDFVDDNGASGFVDQDGDFFAASDDVVEPPPAILLGQACM